MVSYCVICEGNIAVVLFLTPCFPNKGNTGESMGRLREHMIDYFAICLPAGWWLAPLPLLLLGGRMPLATIGNPSINQYLQILVASSVRNAATLQRFPMLCHFSAFADTCVYFCPTQAKSGDFPNLQRR